MGKAIAMGSVEAFLGAGDHDLFPDLPNARTSLNHLSLSAWLDVTTGPKTVRFTGANPQCVSTACLITCQKRSSRASQASNCGAFCV